MSIRPFQTGIMCAAVVLLLAACHRSKPPAVAPVPTVTVRQPVQREVLEWDEYPGRLDPVDMVEVRARVTGYLESVHFKDGGIVRKGDLLFVIDPRPLQAELAREEAVLNQAQTRLEWAINEVARGERLVKSRAISEEEADSRNKARREAEAGVQLAQAAVDAAKLKLDYTRVTAPISGRISRKLMTEGNLVNDGQGQSTLLTTIVSLDPVYCYFDADEKSVLKYQRLTPEGKGGGLRNGQVPCELELSTEKGFPHKGVLDFVDNRVNPTTGTLRLRGVFTNPEPDFILQPGFFARVRVPGSDKYEALLIPDEAVGSDQGRKYVYTVDQYGAIQYRPVELGPVFEGLRVVRNGLSPDEWVVVNGLMSVRPGVKVKADRVSTTDSPATPLARAGE